MLSAAATILDPLTYHPDLPVQISSPPGYSRLVPLDKVKHAGLGVTLPQRYQWAAGLNAVYLALGEFSKASLHYPIAFSRDESIGEYVPVALLGLRQNQNLFVDDQHQWRTQCYLPAYVRRYPFCLSEYTSTNGEMQRMVCVQEDQLQANTVPLINPDGSPTAAWEPMQKLLESMEGARLQTREFTKRLENLGLFSAFDALALPRNGERLRLQGLYRIDEERLNQLGNAEMRGLQRKGALRPIYAHLLSLENFARLMDDAVARAPTQPTTA